MRSDNKEVQQITVRSALVGVPEPPLGSVRLDFNHSGDSVLAEFKCSTPPTTADMGGGGRERLSCR